MIDSQQEDIDTIDRAFATGCEFGISWLRAAFHTHKSQLAHLLERHEELQRMALEWKQGPLTVVEARALGVCRLCKKPRMNYQFTYNYGEEHAHTKCLEISTKGCG